MKRPRSLSRSSRPRSSRTTDRATGRSSCRKRDWLLDELVPPGTVRVVDVLEPEEKRPGRYPVLVVERV
jgi:hypothetical protein